MGNIKKASGIKYALRRIPGVNILYSYIGPTWAYVTRYLPYLADAPGSGVYFSDFQLSEALAMYGICMVILVMQQLL